jgi:plasmid replication initiation protein
MEYLVMTDIDRNKLIVTQANRLIEASYQVTLQQKKLIQIMVGKIRKSDTEFQEYIFSVTDLQRELGIENGRFYEDLKNLTAGLIGRVIKIRSDDGQEIQAAWLSSAVYIPRGTYGLECSCVKLTFAPVLKPFLLQLKDYFAQYEFSQISEMRSIYSIRLYEILNSRRRLHSVTFYLDELKRMFKLEDKYSIARDFRICVIEQAQREIHDKTNLAFDFVENRKRRKVVSITFNIRDNIPTKPSHSAVKKTEVLPMPSIEPPTYVDEQQPPLFLPTESDKETERLYAQALAEGIKNGVDERAMRDLLTTRDHRHVMENIEIARERFLKSKNKDNMNLGGITFSAIIDDYAKDGREKKQARENKAAADKRKKKAKEILETIERNAITARRHDLTKSLEALSDADRDALRAAFVAEIEAGKHTDHMTVSYRTKGWKAAGMEALFRIFSAARLEIGSDADYQHAEAKRLGYDMYKLKADTGK